MKSKYKEEILKEADEKTCYIHIRFKVDFSIENMKAMKQWNAIFIIETANLKLSTHLKIFQNEDEI